MRKKICIVTGSRADWGLLQPLADRIREDKRYFSLQIVACGAHMIKRFGQTYKSIERDGFKIDKKVRMPLRGDTEESIIESISLGLTGFVKAFKFLNPDLVFLLGDRFEILPAALTCLFTKIPIAHIHGGELTEGSIDDSIRHSITKMAQLHFVSTDIYRKRVIQMGESPHRVFNVGALGLDNIKNLKLLKRNDFEKRINFALGRNNIIVTFNSSTLENKGLLLKQFKNLLKVIDEFKDTKVIFTKSNPDLYADAINILIDKYVSLNKHRTIAFASMGSLLYLSSLQFMDAVIGNSSSGIIEAPSFGIPTINIGDRQRGRVRADSVIDIDGRISSIRNAIKKSFSASFRQSCRNIKNPYGNGESAKKITSILKKITIPLPKKSFFDIDLEKILEYSR